MEDQKLPSHESSIPLIARLDHLEFIMKYLERKQRCANNANNSEKQSLDLAKKEAYFKETLFDRVASLEHRLYQLCMDMDSRSTSHPLSRASTQASGESSSSQDSKGEIYYSFPTFNNIPNHADKAIMTQNHIKTTRELQEKSEEIESPMKNSSPPNKQQVLKNRLKKNEKKCKVQTTKKRNPPGTWPYLKLLGC